MGNIDIRGLDKAAVLAALFNAAKPLGAGMLEYNPEPLTVDEARDILGQGRYYFGYLEGRVMHVNLSGDEFSSDLYDRDNGSGAAKCAVDALR